MFCHLNWECSTCWMATMSAYTILTNASNEPTVKILKQESTWKMFFKQLNIIIPKIILKYDITNVAWNALFGRLYFLTLISPIFNSHWLHLVLPQCSGIELIGTQLLHLVHASWNQHCILLVKEICQEYPYNYKCVVWIIDDRNWNIWNKFLFHSVDQKYL